MLHVCCILAVLASATSLRERVNVFVGQSRLALSGPLDCNAPGSSVHGTFQARILEWVPIPSSRPPPDLGIQLVSLTSHALTDGFTTSFAWEASRRKASLTGNQTWAAAVKC